MVRSRLSCPRAEVDKNSVIETDAMVIYQVTDDCTPPAHSPS